MQVTKIILDSSKFKKDFSRLIGNYLKEVDEEQVINELVDKISVVNGSALSFLNSLETITDKRIRIAVRCATIAQMYNVMVDYRSGYPYVDSCADNEELVFLQFRKSTAVVSKNGEVLIGEGVIWLNPGSNYGMGYPISSLENGKKGFLNNYGDLVLPCEFDYVEQHIGEWPTIVYGQATFSLRRHGNLSSVAPNALKDIVECYEEDSIYYLSADSCLYELSYNPFYVDRTITIDEMMSKEAQGHVDMSLDECKNAVIQLMSSYSLSKEEFQEILNKKVSATM